MKYLKTFERVGDYSILNGVSSEFWKMVRISKWNKGIIEVNKDVYDYNKILNRIRGNVYVKYEYHDILKFYNEYTKLNDKLYTYFDKFHNKYDYGVGDDGFGDLLSSVIGKGLTFTKNAIKNPKLLSGMKYMENFEYILHVNYSEYYEIRKKYDPSAIDETEFYTNIDKYNI